MKKLFSTRRGKAVVALICGLAVLVTAAAAGYVTANGYVVYKDALKGLVSRDNYDLRAHMSIDFEGQNLGTADYREMYSSQGQMVAYQANSEGGQGEERYAYEHWYERSGDRDNPYKETYSRNEGEDWIIQSTYSLNTVGGIFGEYFLGVDLSDGSNQQAGRGMKLVESAIDLVVGDLKNNFVATGSDGNGGQGYRIVLSHDQLPEVIRSGMDVIFGEIGTNYRRVITDYDAQDIMPDADGNFDPWEIESNARSEAYDAMANTGDEFAVLHADGSYTLYPTFADYYRSVGLEQMRIEDLSDLFYVMSDTPRVKTAQCEFTVDKYGQLTSNRLYGELLFTDLAGQTRTASMTVDIAVDSLNGPIPGPEIPRTATVTDYTIGNSENGWAYTVTKNGVTVTNSQEKDNQKYELQWLMDLDSIDRVTYVLDWIGMEGTAQLNNDYQNGGSLDWLLAEIEAIPQNEDAMRALDDYASSCGMSAEGLLDILRSDAEALQNGNSIHYNTEEAFGTVDHVADVGIIGGADGPTEIVVTGGNN